MLGVFSTAISGLNVASLRLLASAQNTANASTPNYTPVDVASSAVPVGGAQASLVPRDPAFVKAYLPQDSQADASGYVNLPNVDLAGEAVNGLMASVAYKANAAVIGKAREMDEALLRALDTRA